MSSVEQQILSLRKEQQAIKAFFARSATTLPVFTKTGSIQTKENKMIADYQEWFGPIHEEWHRHERIIATFDTNSGANTIAKIEVSTGDSANYNNIKRVNYPGGAQWIITVSPKEGIAPDIWSPNTVTVAVHSIVNGTLTLEAI